MKRMQVPNPALKDSTASAILVLLLCPSYTRLVMRRRSFPPVSWLRLLSLVFLSGFIVLTGCRTYGNEKYETGPKTYEALQQTMTQMEQNLGRAESDLRRLESAAEARSELQPLAERYQSFVESHEAALEGHREQVEQLSADAAYRTLHRTYGALVTDQRILQRQYQRTTRKVWATIRGSNIPQPPIRSRSEYVDTPVNFPSVDEEVPITMAEALRALEGTPGIQRQEQSGSSE